MPEVIEPRIYRYILTYDGGTAPNPTGGWCTLAICKPRIRRGACRGHWIIGFRSKAYDEIVYVMQVGEKLSFAEYWGDPRFRNRSDNIYKPRHPNACVPDDFEVVPNDVHPAEELGHKARDLGGIYVLVARRFWYFGSQNVPQEIPEALSHLRPVSKSGRPVREVWRAADPAKDIERLKRWLATSSVRSAARQGLRIFQEPRSCRP